jgi:hypothetical protein
VVLAKLLVLSSSDILYLRFDFLNSELEVRSFYAVYSNTKNHFNPPILWKAACMETFLPIHEPQVLLKRSSEQNLYGSAFFGDRFARKDVGLCKHKPASEELGNYSITSFNFELE